MDRGPWQAPFYGVAKELDKTEQLNKNKGSIQTAMPGASVSCSLSILHFRNLIGPMQCIFSSNGFLVAGGKTGSCLSPRSAFTTSKALHSSRRTKAELRLGPRSQQQPLFPYSLPPSLQMHFSFGCLLIDALAWLHRDPALQTQCYTHGLVSAGPQAPPKMGQRTAEAKPFKGHLQPQALRLSLPFVNTLMENRKQIPTFYTESTS